MTLFPTRSMDSSRRPVAQEGGLTLVELLVTILLFSMVTLITSTTYLTLLDTTANIVSTEQSQDEMRAVMSALEREVLYGDGYTHALEPTGLNICDTTSGLCPGMQLQVQGGGLLANYQVVYRLNGTTLEKAVLRPSGQCGPGAGISEQCFLPVTSPLTTLSQANFDWVIPSSYVDQARPVINVSFIGESRSAETGATSPIIHSASYSPKQPLTLTGYVASDTVLPDILFAGSANCNFVSTPDYTNWNTGGMYQTSTPGGCDEVMLRITMKDNTYLTRFEYASDQLVGTGVTDADGDEIYSIPAGVITHGVIGQPQVTHDIDVPLLKGAINRVVLKVFDRDFNERSITIAIDNGGVWTPEVPNNWGISTQLQCYDDGVNPYVLRTYVTPVGGLVPKYQSQYNARIYRCQTNSTGGSCDPFTDSTLTRCVDYWDMYWLPSTEKWNTGCSEMASWSFGQMVDWSSKDEGKTYKYQVTVFDQISGQESSPQTFLFHPNYGGRDNWLCAANTPPIDYTAPFDPYHQSCRSQCSASGYSGPLTPPGGNPPPPSPDDWNDFASSILQVSVNNGSGSATSNQVEITLDSGSITGTANLTFVRIDGTVPVPTSPATLPIWTPSSGTAAVPGTVRFAISIPNTTVPDAIYTVILEASFNGDVHEINIPLLVTKAATWE